MVDAKHTPGPAKQDPPLHLRLHDGEVAVCDGRQFELVAVSEGEAARRLLAFPKMLAALEELVATTPTPRPGNGMRRRVREVLAFARGE